jgi:predicted RNA-binding protein with PIN domain
MRILIDGYNLMYAVGAMPRNIAPDALRKVRHRFLNELGALIPPIDAHQTTVVFDASIVLEHLPKTQTQKGMTILFAVDDDDADSRIEELIRKHSAPKNLTVVSTDLRVRQAATRKKAKAVKSEDFWAELKAKKTKPLDRPAPPSREEKARNEGLSEAESAYWLAEFGHLESAPETKQALRQQSDFVPTDEEIARIAREVHDEPDFK